ncbi:MAG: hypothetical protein NVS3B16_04730 [Vulcanimicrobiaceae bacterium]
MLSMAPGFDAGSFAMGLHRMKAVPLSGPAVTAIFISAACWLSPTQGRCEETVPIVTLDKVSITEAAFSGATGIVRINQAAGVGNMQSNVAIFRVVPLSDGRLDSVTTKTAAPDAKIANLRSRGEVVVSSGVLAGAGGLIQVNQSAGNGNASSNVFTLTIHR